MGKKIYVGNLAFTTTEESVTNLFAEHGTVDSCNLITDRDSGQSKGFAFVEMSTNDEAQGAIAALSGKELEGRQLKVNEARDRETKGGGRGGRGGY
ncbi:MAG: RNA-binding protein [Bdellovibrionales bacterium]|nr:RNA-binding protein [Bdellovibrionales bacterium]